MSIYVEIRIRGSIEEVWRRTQDPALHECWDLRFTQIDYLPRAGDDAPQRFRYATRIGFGLSIHGEGESTGTRDGPAGDRTSALTFWSENAKSLIREGSGYWRYVPVNSDVRFLTWYAYRTRFGFWGRIIDAIFFHRLMGWATAWSFDRLRLWIERGIDPVHSMQRSIAHAVARLALATVLLYQGLVPKLLYRHPTELAMLSDAGLAPETATVALNLLGVMEVAVGILLLVAWRARWPLAAIAALMPVTLVGIAITSPYVLPAAFNPVALNVSVAALAAIAWVMSKDLPSATHCLRARPAGEG